MREGNKETKGKEKLDEAWKGLLCVPQGWLRESPYSLAVVEQGVKHMFVSRAFAFYFF